MNELNPLPMTPLRRGGGSYRLRGQTKKKHKVEKRFSVVKTLTRYIFGG